jgi:hypothetical protein
MVNTKAQDTKQADSSHAKIDHCAVNTSSDFDLPVLSARAQQDQDTGMVPPTTSAPPPDQPNIHAVFDSAEAGSSLANSEAGAAAGLAPMPTNQPFRVITSATPALGLAYSLSPGREGMAVLPSAPRESPLVHDPSPTLTVIIQQQPTVGDDLPETCAADASAPMQIWQEVRSGETSEPGTRFTSEQAPVPQLPESPTNHEGVSMRVAGPLQTSPANSDLEPAPNHATPTAPLDPRAMQG